MCSTSPVRAFRTSGGVAAPAAATAAEAEYGEAAGTSAAAGTAAVPCLLSSMAEAARPSCPSWPRCPTRNHSEASLSDSDRLAAAAAAAAAWGPDGSGVTPGASGGGPAVAATAGVVARGVVAAADLERADPLRAWAGLALCWWPCWAWWWWWLDVACTSRTALIACSTLAPPSTCSGNMEPCSYSSGRIGSGQA